MNDHRIAVYSCILSWALCGSALAETPRTKLSLDVDFPGGSGIVQQIDQARRMVRITPSRHKDRGWPCWWFVKLSGVKPGETITLVVTEGYSGRWSRPDRAAFSTDGKTWKQTPAGRSEGKQTTYRQKIDAAQVWFAWGPPFVPDDAQKLVDRLAKQSKYATAFELCKSAAGRATPALRIKQPGVDDARRVGIWINARQHAWESGGSWVCRGLSEWIVSDDPRAETLRKKSLITIVPIMDIDNAAIGAGGKNQTPHDHNRDWSAKPHYKAVEAAIAEIRRQNTSGRFDMFLDLHNPGPNATRPFFYITPRKLLSPRGRINLDRFLAAAGEMAGPLAYQGEVHESGKQYDRNWKKISKNWVSLNTRDHVVAVTLETAWNTPHSTTAGYQQVGRELGQAVERYFRGETRGRMVGE
jgi:hypothetical protein